MIIPAVNTPFKSETYLLIWILFKIIKIPIINATVHIIILFISDVRQIDVRIFGATTGEARPILAGQEHINPYNKQQRKHVQTGFPISTNEKIILLIDISANALFSFAYNFRRVFICNCYLYTYAYIYIR